jgi:hypothetical protein
MKKLFILLFLATCLFANTADSYRNVTFVEKVTPAYWEGKGEWWLRVSTADGSQNAAWAHNKTVIESKFIPNVMRKGDVWVISFGDETFVNGKLQSQ